MLYFTHIMYIKKGVIIIMSKVYNWTKKIDSNELKECSNIIKSGGIVVFPTETVYGIGTNAFIEESIKKIYEIKKRPLEKICSILIANKKDIIKYANICNDVEKKIINNFMPGPITIILQKKEGVLEHVTGNKETIGIRIPQNEIILEILKEVNIPILAPSANISGETSGTNINEIMEKFKDKVDIYINGGKCKFEESSTIVQVINNEPVILREGKIKLEDIKKVL
ncbi:MAG: threonylcarbamoyl-AMP synthase [Clostridiales bacterium]|nr:threonylcarbamoyl-AMP synthase [Clostridiales bacterium]